MKTYWFKRKKYGFGWTPATWQGWLVTTAYLLLVIASFFFHTSDASTASEPLSYIIPEVILYTFFLLFITVQTGESPQWQWGPSVRSEQTHSGQADKKVKSQK